MSAVAVGRFISTKAKRRKLADVVRFVGGGTPSKGTAAFWGGNVPWVSPKDMKSDVISTSEDKITAAAIEGSATKWIPRDATLIVVRSGILARTVPVCIAGRDLTINQDLKALIPDKSLDPRYLFLFLKSREPELLESVTSSATVHRISTVTLESLEITLPALDEQKRIVAVLDQAFAALDRARANADANVADAKQFMESYVERQLAKSMGAVVTLQELLDTGAIVSHLDGNHGSEYPRKDEFVTEGVPYISANCIDGNEIDFDRAKYLTPERAARIRKGIARDRDVLFAHNATVGPVVLLRTDYEAVILSTSLTYYRCESTKIVPEFLVYEMRGAGFRRQYEAVMKQATRSQVPITAQRKFVHTIPSVAIQRELAEKCSEVEKFSSELARKYAAQLDDLAALRQSLLQKAFAGELS